MSLYPWRVVYDTSAIRRTILVAVISLPVFSFFTFNAINSGRITGTIIGLGILGYLTVRFWRSATARVITSPEGLCMVNRWSTIWLPWGKIKGVEVDSLVVSEDVLERMPASFRRRFYNRKDVIFDEHNSDARVVERARVLTETGEIFPLGIITGESLLVISQALLMHRQTANTWPDFDDPLAPA